MSIEVINSSKSSVVVISSTTAEVLPEEYDCKHVCLMGKGQVRG